MKSSTKNFFYNLSSKTRITMLFCGCLILLTGLLLIFLMLCPVKKENLSNHANENLLSVATTASTEATNTEETTVTPKNTRKTTDKKRARSTTTKTTTKEAITKTEEMTEEERNAELERLKKESEDLTEWEEV